jgi:probable rRNA maturation factor
MLEINNLTKYKLDEKSFTQVAKKVLKGENKVLKTFSLAFVEKDEMQKLNKKYRKKNKPTDVLSFNFDEGNNLGEIVICPEFIKDNGKDFKKEVMQVFIHGILHLLGYDHEKSKNQEKIMEKKQDKYLAEFYNGKK